VFVLKPLRVERLEVLRVGTTCPPLVRFQPKPTKRGLPKYEDSFCILQQRWQGMQSQVGKRRQSLEGRIMSEVKVKKGESVDKALRRLKKKMDREQTLQTVRIQRRYEKPSARKRRKMKAARFSAMLKERYADV
jgi:small subunit ribosomal protein S21